MSFAKRIRDHAIPALVMLAVTATAAHGQIDAIRRARAELSGKLPSVASLFGDQPGLTTSLEDAVDGVPQLDGFAPTSFSPMDEMPRGINGRFFLAPGSYTFDAESYCLRAGTYGPAHGNGYLYAEFKGPKSSMIRNILLRASDHPELTRSQIQLLLWSIIARAKYDRLPEDIRRTARAILTPQENLDLQGYGLDVVQDGVKNRVLQTVPGPVRRVYEAENDMRRMLSGTNATFEDIERVAVLTGAPPTSELTEVVREGRWSYHPNGFFIRYDRSEYTSTRIQVYFPAAFRIERDGKGHIISVTTEDGRRAERGAGAPSSRSRTDAPVWITVAARSRARSLEMRDLVRFALTDVSDLSDFLRTLANTHTDKAAEMSAIVKEAEHAALARYYGLRKQSSALTVDRLTETLRPARTSRGYSYVVAPLPVAGPTVAQVGGRKLNDFPPGGGASMPQPPHQRGGSSARSSSPNSADKAKKATGAMQKAAGLLGPVSGGLGGGGLPNAMVGAGLNQAFDAANKIDGALQGGSPDDDASTAEMVGTSAAVFPARWINASLTTRRQTPDFMVLSKPVDISAPPVAAGPGVPAEQAAAVNAVTASTLRLASTMTAAALARRRLKAAGTAHNDEWENRQARALLHLRRTAGETMLALARDLAAYRTIAANNPPATITAAQVADAQRQLATGFSPDVVSAMKRLGMTDDALEKYRQELLAKDAGIMASSAPAALRELEDAMKEYGEYWMTLPVVPAPWN